MAQARMPRSKARAQRCLRPAAAIERAHAPRRARRCARRPRSTPRRASTAVRCAARRAWGDADRRCAARRRKPRVVTNTVRSPLRSSSALVATVVPIFTASMSVDGQGAPGATPSSSRMPCDRGVVVALGILGQQLVRDQRAVGAARHDVGEGAAAVDPELPAGAGPAFRHYSGRHACPNTGRWMVETVTR